MGASSENWVDECHEAAKEATGYRDFGDKSYLSGLRRFADAIKQSSDLNEFGRASAHGLIVSVLSARLLTQQGWNTHPEVLQAPLTRPLILIGIPRTGTTALHQLLSLDPQFQGIESWLCGAPMVRPPRETWAENRWFQARLAMFRHIREFAPDMRDSHAVEADEVDECLEPMAQNFCSNYFGSYFDIPAYDSWFQAQDECPSYARYGNVLRLVGRDDSRRWLLKNPSHVFGIDALLSVFPDACIVQTHRHPSNTIASLTHLLGAVRKLMSGAATVNRHAIQAREVAFWSEATRRSMAAQDRDPARFVNVKQSDIRKNPLGVVEAIYGDFGLNLSSGARAAMLKWAETEADQEPQSSRYESVTDTAEIESAFAPYIQRYSL